MMRVTGLTVSGYRSIREIWFPVDPVGVFVGENGVGKSNLYRCLQLLQGAATGTLVRDLAAEGGMDSASWAGERCPTDAPGIVLEADIAAPDVGGAYRYRVEIGRYRTHARDRGADGFPGEPRVVSESLSFMFGGRETMILERKNRGGWAVDDAGKRHVFSTDLMGSETALSTLADPARFPDVDAVRRMLGAWRFYHTFRTDPASPLRRPTVGVSSPSLDADGANLAAVLATAMFLRDGADGIKAAVADAFPGCEIEMPLPGDPAERATVGGITLPPVCEASFYLTMPDLGRLFSAAELSDGQMRYLALVGALLSYRPAPFIALNEPETSLHPGMLPALGRLIAAASKRSQVWLVTHSAELGAAIGAAARTPVRKVLKREGATWIEGLGLAGFEAE